MAPLPQRRGAERQLSAAALLQLGKLAERERRAILARLGAKITEPGKAEKSLLTPSVLGANVSLAGRGKGRSAGGAGKAPRSWVQLPLPLPSGTNIRETEEL